MTGECSHKLSLQGSSSKALALHLAYLGLIPNTYGPCVPPRMIPEYRVGSKPFALPSNQGSQEMILHCLNLQSVECTIYNPV